jgi:hypothetical protein
MLLSNETSEWPVPRLFPIRRLEEVASRYEHCSFKLMQDPEELIVIPLACQYYVRCALL